MLQHRARVSERRLGPQGRAACLCMSEHDRKWPVQAPIAPADNCPKLDLAHQRQRKRCSPPSSPHSTRCAPRQLGRPSFPASQSGKPLRSLASSAAGPHALVAAPRRPPAAAAARSASWAPHCGCPRAMDVVVCDLGSRFLRAGKADPFPNDKEPWVVSLLGSSQACCLRVKLRDGTPAAQLR